MQYTPRYGTNTLSIVTPRPPEEHEYPGLPASAPPYIPYPASYSYQQVVVPVIAPTSGWATASLVFAILGMITACCTFGVFSAAAVMCGHVALGETRSGQRSGRGMAVAGLIMGYLVIGPAIALSIIAMFQP